MKKLLYLFFSLFAVISFAANYYARPNAAPGTYGTEDGSSWNNAFNGIPPAAHSFWTTAAAAPGVDTIYLAGGSYTSNWEIAADEINIVRAVTAEHSGDPGWNPSMDSQVVLDSFRIIIGGAGDPENGYDNITFDGKIESGIKINDEGGSVVAPLIDLSPGDEYPSTGIEFRYVEIAGGSGSNPTINDRPYGGGGNYGSLTIRFCKLHNGGRPIIELGAVNSVVIYGSLFYQRGGVAGTAILAGATTSNVDIYNNTFVDFTTAINAASATALDMQNNLFYNNITHVTFGTGTRDYNWYSGASHFGEANGEHNATANPFRDTVMHDYYLTFRTNAGSALGGGYTTDMLGKTRGADGNADRGALEYRGVDIMLVLDRSGSMTMPAFDPVHVPASPGSPPVYAAGDAKIDALKTTAHHFTNVMRNDIGNYLGVVQFNQAVVPFSTPADIAAASLSEMDASKKATLLTTAYPSITAGGLTGIGGALQAAQTQLMSAPDPYHDKVILAVTDGMENQIPTIATVQGGLISDGIKVSTLGLGVASGVNGTLLNGLSMATSGYHDVLDDTAAWDKFFFSVMNDAMDGAYITDPLNEVKFGDVVEIPVQVSEQDKSVMFTTFWNQADYFVGLELVAPDGTVIQPDQIYLPRYGKWVDHTKNIEYGNYTRYAFYRIKFPMPGIMLDRKTVVEIPKTGTWRMRLIGGYYLGEGFIPYSLYEKNSGDIRIIKDKTLPEGDYKDITVVASSFATADSLLNMTSSIKEGKEGELFISATVKTGSLPVPGAAISVFAQIPTVNIGNILVDKYVDPDLIAKIIEQQKRNNTPEHPNDVDTPEQVKLNILQAESNNTIIRQEFTKFRLYDDGEHGDGKRGDGIYGNVFTGTRIPGMYHFRIVASGIPGGGRTLTTRESNISFTKKLTIKPGESDIKVDIYKRTNEYILYNLFVTPRDSYKNLAGPGQIVEYITEVPNPPKRTKIQRAPLNADTDMNGEYFGQFPVAYADIEKLVILKILLNGDVIDILYKQPGKVYFYR